MTREITAQAEAASRASHVDWCALVELSFDSGALRLTNAGHSLPWDGHTWLGAGQLTNIEPVSEVASPQAAALNIRFSGIESAWRDVVLSEPVFARPAKIWLALLDEELRIQDDPVLIFEGRIDEPTVTIGDEISIQLSLENRFADWNRPRLAMWSHADQQVRFPGDLFFERASAMENTSIKWGTYHGPVAPDPLKLFNRSLDRALSNPIGRGILNPAGLTRATVNAARYLGDRIAKVFGW